MLRKAIPSSRRLMMAALLALVVALTSLGAPSDQARAAEPEDRVRQMLEDNSTNATVGLYLKEVNGAVIADFNETFVYEPASTIKDAVGLEAMRQVQLGNVTLGTQINWLADASKFDGNNNYIPGGSDCPTDNTVNMTSSLDALLRLMLEPSDNAATQGLRDFFGDANIAATMAALNMDDSALNHSIGCGAAAVANPNELTLVDNGRLYEGVANGFLVEPFRATFYDVMIDAFGNSNQDQGAQNIVNNIITQEAAGLGLSNATLNDFRDEVNFAFKAGSYTLNPGGQFQSIGGWADIPFLADCQPAAREYVWGVFIHGADAGSIPGTFSIWTPGLELLREQVRAALDTQAACEADLEIVSMQVLNPPADIPVNTSVPITIRKEVRNNGPADVIDATVDLTAIAPADCQVTPGQASQAVMGLAEGQLETVDEQVAIECSQPSFHTFQFDNEIAPLDPNVNDPDPTNNDAFTSLQVAVIAQADLAITGWDFAELDDAAIDAFLVEGDPFVFSTAKTVHNFGDTVGGLYSDPVDAVVTRSVEVPEGIEGSVHIGPHEAPATVTIEKPGDPPVVMGNVAAGAVIAEEGPAVITVEFAVDDLEVSVDRILDEVFDLQCLEPSQHEISFVNEIAASDQHVEDPDLSNNTVEVARTIECVTPVQINIKPGSDPNAINPKSKGEIAVAVLTTDAGEYGLPVAFDATAIDPLSVRFGPADVLETGSGAFESHGTGHLEDSLELDEQTSDGDTDMVLHFKTQETGIDAATTEACVIGSYLGPDDLLHSFFGCDAVSIKPKP